MKRLLILIAFLPYLSYGQKTDKKEVIWYSFAEAMQLAKTVPRPIIIDMYTDWCGWCKRMDAATYADTAIASYINAHFYAVKFNAETKDKIPYNDTIWSNDGVDNGSGRKPTHPLAQKLLQGQMSYPTTVYMVPSIGLVAPVAGYMSPQDIEPILLYFGENIYGVNNVFEAYTKGLKASKILK